MDVNLLEGNADSMNVHCLDRGKDAEHIDISVMAQPDGDPPDGPTPPTVTLLDTL
jgi:hypothetical protein